MSSKITPVVYFDQAYEHFMTILTMNVYIIIVTKEPHNAILKCLRAT